MMSWRPKGCCFLHISTIRYEAWSGEWESHEQLNKGPLPFLQVLCIPMATLGFKIIETKSKQTVATV